MNQPSESLKEKMIKFFYQTSIPRILAKEAQQVKPAEPKAS